MISGSNINLTCSVTGSPEPPQYIYWFLGNSLINYSSRGGISVVTDKHSKTSRLVVTRAVLADSGNYTCAPANSEPASISVYILSGKIHFIKYLCFIISYSQNIYHFINWYYIQGFISLWIYLLDIWIFPNCSSMYYLVFIYT